MKLLDALASLNVRAFLRMIRHGEGTSDDDGYRRMFGGQLFDNNFVDHPRSVQTANLRKGGQISSSAAGAYQFLTRTWDGLVQQYGFSDFSPHNQDLGAIALILGRKALDDVIAGHFDVAVAKCAKEWASLPGSPYGQPTTTLAKAREVYQTNGGAFAEAEPPLAPADPGASYANPDLYTTPTTPKGKPMPPFILAALPALFEAVPKLIKSFSDDGVTVPQRNEQAVMLAVDVAKKALGVPNEQALVEALQANPEAVATVRSAIDEAWSGITDLSGVADARKADKEAMAAGTPMWHSPAFVITVLLLPLVYGTVWQTLTGDFTPETKAMVIAAIVSGVLTGITGFWLGTSFSSGRKTELLAAKPSA